MESIVIETNKYAWECIVSATEIGLPTHSRVHDWVETTIPELYRLIAVFIIMSICQRGRIDEYWSGGFIDMPKFRKIMSKNRFLLLMQFLYFADNRLILEHGPERKLANIKPIVDYLNTKFQAAYMPRRELSLDESLLLWKGHLSWIQCIWTGPKQRDLASRVTNSARL